MAKSLRSKRERKFRNIRRDTIHGPYEKARLERLAARQAEVKTVEEEDVRCGNVPGVLPEINMASLVAARSAPRTDSATDTDGDVAMGDKETADRIFRLATMSRADRHRFLRGEKKRQARARQSSVKAA
ncbi:hypothetical protein CXG81DRAFT_25354 [Caulochytrium protostelioides]|uniref:DUF2423 domain-containing protein n=1 Tax=Caulochytrium protostelioides TaxID=1555241 RepID=A0A4P9X9M7_9FUNG|nr:hypothetical protein CAUPRSCDRAFT_11638 [Caulochytrium protostelioides]RKP02002.1 hypothetical protein CXG81DRAFT_25354 [Caulochytrium protostelioides]|eukprot:RKP02002.1 hypothetical protein CXG81DRAFT_25354 [Caulochytrium protostelioides]